MSNRPNQIPAKPRKNRRNNGLRNKSPAPLLREKSKNTAGNGPCQSSRRYSRAGHYSSGRSAFSSGIPQLPRRCRKCMLRRVCHKKQPYNNWLKFVSAYRKYKDKLNFDIFIEYIASPRIDGKVLVLTDPMLATGGSMELSYKALLTKGTPKDIHIASVIASRQAIDYVKDHFPENTTIWVGAIDDKLDEHSYIVPGLGDAGDLAYGIKE